MDEASAAPASATSAIPTESDRKAAMRKEAVAAFHECKTNAERLACVKKYPVLEEIYSSANWS